MSENPDIRLTPPLLRPVEVLPYKEDGKEYAIIRDPQGFSKSALVVSLHLLPILARFDGKNTVQEISNQLKTPEGKPFPEEKLVEIIELLDRSHYLDNDNFKQHREEVIYNYRSQTTRSMTLVKNNAPADQSQFDELLGTFLETAPSLYFHTKLQDHEQVIGLMLPHIDYQRGGKSYGRAYRQWIRRLSFSKNESLLIGIIGVAHAGIKTPLVATAKDFETPYGILRYDRPALKILENRLGDWIFDDEWVHQSEHSIEIQTIWLKYLLNDYELSFLPLLAGNFETLCLTGKSPQGVEQLEQVLEALKTIEELHQGPVIWISSVDLAHIGPRFGDSDPVDDTQCKKVRELDEISLQAIEKCDAEDWWFNVMRDGNSRKICGLSANYLMLRLMEGSEGKIIDYSQARSNGQDQMVSFASALFVRQDR